MSLISSKTSLAASPMPSRFKQCTPMWWGSTRWCHTSPCSFRQSTHAWTAWTNLVPSGACSSKRPQEVPWFQQRHNDLIFAWLHQGKNGTNTLQHVSSGDVRSALSCLRVWNKVCLTTQVSQLLEPIGLPASASWRKTIAHMRSRPVRWSNTSFSDIWVEKCICHHAICLHCAFEPSIKTCKRTGWTCKSRKNEHQQWRT